MKIDLTNDDCAVILIALEARKEKLQELLEAESDLLKISPRLSEEEKEWAEDSLDRTERALESMRKGGAV